MTSNPVEMSKAELSEIFDRDRLMNEAVAETGLDDFGDDRFLEPLDRWLKALVTESDLDPEKVVKWRGAKQANYDVERMLVNRLRFQDDLKRHPEILDEQVTDPLVVIGLPRTGSTLTQRLLCQDPAIQYLSYWRDVYPAPLPGWKRGEPDARIDLVREQLALMQQAFPELMQRHAFIVDEPEEENLLMALTFESAMPNGWPYNLSSFMDWTATRPIQNVYDFLRDMLKYLQWQEGSGRPWVLKCVCHTGSLAALCETFPQVTLVHTHRDPTRVISSICLNAEVQWGLAMHTIDREEIGRRVLSFFSGEMDKYLIQRAELAGQFDIIDIPYNRVVSDSLSVVREIYDRRGVPFSDEATRRVSAWIDDNPRFKFGKQAHSLEQYGLAHDDVTGAFDTYLGQFEEYL